MSATAATRRLGVTGGTGKTITTDIPAWLDRLPWSRWQGLEVTLVGSVAAVLKSRPARTAT